MNIEKKKIESYAGEDGKTFGIIRLERLAIPETVQVTFLDETLIPKSFDIFGHPVFTEEQALYCQYRETELRLQKSQKGELFVQPKADILYQERIFDVPRETFDTIEGIRASLGSLSDLNEMLFNRRRFLKANEVEILNKFILFGKFYLESDGTRSNVKQKGLIELVSSGDVEDYATFMENNNHHSGVDFEEGVVIPLDGECCPCCGKAFIIDDVKANQCLKIKGKIYHESCWRKYERYTEIDLFTRRMVGLYYSASEYSCELLPNGYSQRKPYSHLPWFLFHTIDGDITIGRCEFSISIEWMENYRYFDMQKVFGEDADKIIDKTRGRRIHVAKVDDACEYIKKVVNEIRGIT